MMNGLLFMVLTLSWSGAYLAIHYVVAVYPPFFAAGMRVLLCTFLMAPFAWRLLRQAMQSPRSIYRGALSGLFFMGFAWALVFWGQQMVAPAVTSILIAATAILNALVLPYIDRGSRVQSHQWVGIVFGFVGIMLVFWPQLQAGPSSHVLGLAAILGTALCYAIGGALVQSVTRQLDGRVIFVLQNSAAGIFLIALSAITETWPSWNTMLHANHANLGMGYLIVVSSCLAFLIYYYLIRVWGVVATTTTVFTIPLVSLILDVIFLRQIPSWHVLLGAVVIFAGVYYVQYKGRNLRLAKV